MNSSFLDKLDNLDINKYFPILVIAFAELGWILADGRSKTQFVRLIDVILYGPYLAYIAYQKEYIFSNLEKIFLLFLGITTITYNARNMLRIK